MRRRKVYGILFAALFLGSLAVMCGAESALKSETVGFGAGIAYMALGLLMMGASLYFGRLHDNERY